MCIRDRGITTTPCSALTKAPSHSSSKRTLNVVALDNTCYDSRGIVPYMALPSTPLIITPSPFGVSGWCHRIMTTKELARIFDLPVAMERRLGRSQGSTLTPDHPLLTSIPGKVVQHSMWLLRLFTATPRGGDISSLPDLSQPLFTLDLSLIHISEPTRPY